MSLAAAALAAGFALDVGLGELPDAAHPVAWLGRVLDRADRRWARPRLVGGCLALLVPVFAALVLGVIVALGATANPWIGVALGGTVVFVSTSYRSLLLTVRRVSRLAERDLEAARRELRALAGREAAALEPDQVRSAALESLGENLADGLVAPLLAFGLGATVGSWLGLAPAAVLGVACAGVVWIKAVNTMDSMWGYPDRPLGTAAARLDDFAMWLPARVAAALLAAAFASPHSLRRARRWLDRVASPNAGWPMGVVAAALDVRLEKPGHYALNDRGRAPDPASVARGLRRVGLAGLVAYLLAGVLAWS